MTLCRRIGFKKSGSGSDSYFQFFHANAESPEHSADSSSDSSSDSDSSASAISADVSDSSDPAVLHRRLSRDSATFTYDGTEYVCCFIAIEEGNVRLQITVGGMALFPQNYMHPVLGCHPFDSRQQCVAMVKWGWPDDDARANQLLVTLRVLIQLYGENDAFSIFEENWVKGTRRWFDLAGMQINRSTKYMQILFKQDITKVFTMHSACVCLCMRLCVCLCAWV